MAEESNDLYANLVRFSTTAWDIRLSFGQMINRGEQEEFEPKITITLPWLQAKIMAVYLQLNLFFHEKTYGKIEMPPNLLPSLPEPGSEVSDEERNNIEHIQRKLQQILATLDFDPS
jgi:hypothetical protein